MTRAAFENAVVAAAALGASSNCPIHMVAIARHMGIEHSLEDWQRLGPQTPLLVDMQPAGRFLGESFHRAGGVPAVMAELLRAGRIDGTVRTVTGHTLAENLADVKEPDREVIRSFSQPLKANAGYVVLSGNLFDSAVIKMSVIDDAFRARFLSHPGRPNVFEGKAVVFEGPEDYHARIEDPSLQIEEQSVLVIRNCGPIGYPGGAEVVNMQPPVRMLEQGIDYMPTIGDGRQSGTSANPSILNASPEAAVGGGLALLKSGDMVRIDLNTRRVDVLLPPGELEARRAAWTPPELVTQTPWEAIYRSMVGQQGQGACLEPATLFLNIIETRGESRNNH
jgi:dihydroxy-acid dehydratase